MKSVAVIGLGEVGLPLYSLIVESETVKVYGLDIDPNKSVNSFEEVPKDLEFLHICYPYTKNFVGETLNYIRRYTPRAVIIHSTVAPGTTRKVFKQSRVPVGYSPVRGRHPKLREHLKFWSKWVAVIPRDRESNVVSHLKSLGLEVKTCSTPETLELAKLFETVYRALMIAFWQEAHRTALRYGGDIGEIAEFIGEVHQVLKDRPIYYPGVIGGHCLIPNTRILEEASPSPLWKFILESNEMRFSEIENEKVVADIERVKKMWLKYVPKWYFE